MSVAFLIQIIRLSQVSGRVAMITSHQISSNSKSTPFLMTLMKVKRTHMVLTEVNKNFSNQWGEITLRNPSYLEMNHQTLMICRAKMLLKTGKARVYLVLELIPTRKSSPLKIVSPFMRLKVIFKCLSSQNLITRKKSCCIGATPNKTSSQRDSLRKWNRRNLNAW